MTTSERRFLHAANLLVVGTGVVYAAMRYLMEPADEWSVVNHPWQPHVQHLHVLAAPLLVFACGLIWHRHISGKIRSGNGRRRRSGPGLIAALVPMIASGYLLQVSVDEGWRQLWLVAHLGASGLWVLTFVGHLLIPERWRRGAEPSTGADHSTVVSRSRSDTNGADNGLRPAARVDRPVAES